MSTIVSNRNVLNSRNHTSIALVSLSVCRAFAWCVRLSASLPCSTLGLSPAASLLPAVHAASTLPLCVRPVARSPLLPLAALSLAALSRALCLWRLCLPVLSPVCSSALCFRSPLALCLRSVCASPCLLPSACAPPLLVPLRLRFSPRPAAVLLRRCRRSPVTERGVGNGILKLACWIGCWGFFLFLLYVYNEFPCVVARGSEDLAS